MTMNETLKIATIMVAQMKNTYEIVQEYKGNRVNLLDALLRGMITVSVNMRNEEETKQAIRRILADL